MYVIAGCCSRHLFEFEIRIRTTWLKFLGVSIVIAPIQNKAKQKLHFKLDLAHYQRIHTIPSCFKFNWTLPTKLDDSILIACSQTQH